MSMIAMKIGVGCKPAEALAAINSIEGLSQWWTTETRGDSKLGGTIQFRFNGEGPDMEVTKSTDDTVVWKCLSGHAEWAGTELQFEIREESETIILFQHRNWETESPMFHHCSMKWAAFLFSLKYYLDEGVGRPFPNDIKVSTLGY